MTTVRVVDLSEQGPSEIILDSIVVSWHQTIFGSHTAQASRGFCQLRSSTEWAAGLSLVVLRYHLSGVCGSGLMAVTSSWL